MRRSVKFLSLVIAVTCTLTSVPFFSSQIGKKTQVRADESSKSERVYLEDCKVLTSDRYTGNMGDSYIAPIKDKYDGGGACDLKGNSYTHGLEAWIARWNYKQEKSWASTVLNLTDFHDPYKEELYLHGHLVILESYNTSRFNVSVQFLNYEDKCVGSYSMAASSTGYNPFTIDVTNISFLEIRVKDLQAEMGGTKIGIVNAYFSKDKYASDDAPEYLSDCQVVKTTRYEGNEGDSSIRTLENYTKNKGVDVNNKHYDHGIVAWVARWNDKDEISWVDSVYDVYANNSRYLVGEIVTLPSYNTTNFDTKISFIDYNTKNELNEYRLTPDSLPKTFCIDVSRVAKLEIKIQDNIPVSMQTLFFLGDVKFTDTEPTPIPVPEVSFDEFVERLYTVALGRESDADGMKYWTSEIKKGLKSGAECAEFFLLGPEFKKLNYPLEKFIDILYQTFFGREADQGGKNYWIGELQKKAMTREEVIKSFIDSKEWCNICASYGIKSGAPSAKSEKASSNAENFATRLYTQCLGRDPEEKGLNYWSLALTNLEQTGSAAAKLFFESEEFQNLKTSNKEFVTRLYRTFMGREPEEGGLTYWVGELNKGASRASVLSGFASSDEFTNICKEYSIDRGTI